MKNLKSMDVALLVLRLFAGLTLLYFGSQKMLGVFGGKGFTPTIAMFEQNMGIPPPFAVCAIFAEFFGALGLVFGFLTRVAAFGFMSTMLVASYQHVKGLDLMAPASFKDFTYPLLLAGMAAALLASGSGRISIDSHFAKKKSGSG